MKKETLLAIAAAITAIANDLGDCSAAPVQTGDGSTTEPPAKKRGRPPTTEKPAETQQTPTEQPSQPERAAEAPPLDKAAVEKAYQNLRQIIEKPVKGNLGAEVKKVIASYRPADFPEDTIFNLQELAKLPQLHAAFEKDIQAVAAAAY